MAIAKGVNLKQTGFFFVFLFVFALTDVQAQCAMCRAALESEASGVKAEAVNDGIVYLMAIPYILVAVIGYAVYRLKYGKSKEAK
ncbi:hypothetical protein [Flavobacterium suncheonense]|uniref:hypothetical protein n=1 Tax=Flavobacterium suncheonense TaxID=350894 RepID=UPI003FA3A1DD